MGGGARDREGGGGPFGVLFVALGLVLLVLAPLLAQMMQLAISRRREFLADVSAIELTRYPPGLLSALRKLEADSTVVSSATRATAHMWIEQPTAQHRNENKLAWLNRLFNTHPPLPDRIAALEALLATTVG